MVNLLLDRGEQVGWLTDCAVPYPNFDPLAGSLRSSILSLDIEMAKLLLAHGADLSLRDDGGLTAADQLPDDDHDRVIKRALLQP